MDLSTILAFVPVEYGAYVFAVFGICAVVAAVWKQPAEGSKLLPVWAIVNALGANAGHAVNLVAASRGQAVSSAVADAVLASPRVTATAAPAAPSPAKAAAVAFLLGTLAVVSLSACTADQIATGKADAQKVCLIYSVAGAADTKLVPSDPTTRTVIADGCALANGKPVTVTTPQGSVTVTPAS